MKESLGPSPDDDRRACAPATRTTHTFRGPFLEKPVFHIRPSEASFDLERRGNSFLDSENGFLDLDNWFLEFGILKYQVP